MRLFLRFVITKALIPALLSLLLVGCGVRRDVTPPTISSRAVEVPGSFSFEGGPVVISAQVADAGGVAQVSATISGPGSESPTSVPMSLTSGSTYSGEYTAPENLREDGQAETYSVVIVARDNAGNTSQSAPVTFQVPPPDMPQPPF